MLDIRLIKENPEDIIKRMADKGKDVRTEVEEILKLDGERRALILETDNLKAEQNKVSKEIPLLKKQGKDDLRPEIENGKAQVEMILDMAANGDKNLIEFKKQYNENNRTEETRYRR